MSEELENPYQCTVCDQRFSDKSAREKHYFSHIRSSGVGRCYDCGSFCMNASKHCKERPSKKKLKKCRECQIYFISEAELREHKYVSHRENSICELCGKSFTTKRGAQLHMRLHFNLKPYVCDVCGKAFGYKTTLVNHQSTHSNVKAFACEFCKRGFGTKSGLKKHYLTHTQEKPYECEMCGRCFGAKGNLKTHYRTHNKHKKESDSVN